MIVIKAFLYRVFATAITFAVLFIAMRDFPNAFGVTLGIELLKAVEYMIFEYLWERWLKNKIQNYGKE